MADEQPQVVTVDVLANLFGLPLEAVYKLAKMKVIEAVPAPGVRGRAYPFVESVQRYIKHLRRQADGGSGEVTVDIKKADLLKKTIEASRLEIKAAIEQGRVHTTNDIRLVMNDMLGSFKVRLWNLPLNVGFKLGLNETQIEVLKDEVTDMCAILAAYSPDDFYARNPDLLEVSLLGSEEDDDEPYA